MSCELPTAKTLRCVGCQGKKAGQEEKWRVQPCMHACTCPLTCSTSAACILL